MEVYILIAGLFCITSVIMISNITTEKRISKLKLEIEKNRFEINDTKRRLGLGHELSEVEDWS